MHNPETGVNCILFYGVSSRPTMKHAGPFRLATELRKYGYSVQTIDATVFDGFDDDLQKLIDKIVTEKTYWIGVSTSFLDDFMKYPFFFSEKERKNRIDKDPQFDNQLKNFILKVKQKNSKIKLLAGGTRNFKLGLYGFQTFKFYSEKEIVEFTDWCADKNTSPKFDFYLGEIQGSEFKHFVDSQIIYDKSDVILKNEPLPIEVSRGCIFKCKFCRFPLNGKTKGEWVKNSHILKEEFIRNYEEHGATNYIFCDDTYNDSVDKLKILTSEVFEKLNFKINYMAYLRLDLIVRYPETAKLLADSGLVSAIFGIETINHESGKCIGKGLDPKIQLEFHKQLKKNEFKNVHSHTGLIVGLPKDRPNEMEIIENFLFSEDNTFDRVYVKPLFINTLVDKNSGSVFDLEYEKYGYTFENVNTRNWTNKNINLSYIEAKKFSELMMKKLKDTDRNKIAEFTFLYYASLGVTREDLVTLSKRQIHEKYNIDELIKNSKNTYKKFILSKFF